MNHRNRKQNKQIFITRDFIKNTFFKKFLIKKMCLFLKQNKIIAVDTDTVPGLMIDANNKIASQLLFSAKNRPMEKKLVLVTHDWGIVKEILDLRSINQKKLKEIMSRFWPGRYTFVFNVNQNYQKTYGKTLAVRIPKNTFLLEFLKFYGKPIYLTSINKSGDIPFLKVTKRNAPKIKSLSPHIALMIDSCESVLRRPSSILDLTQEKVRGQAKVLRE